MKVINQNKIDSIFYVHHKKKKKYFFFLVMTNVKSVRTNKKKKAEISVKMKVKQTGDMVDRPWDDTNK